MSSAYRETGTMAWPGEPETNYNIKVPVWESIGIEVEPKYPDTKYDFDRPISFFEEELQRDVEKKAMIAADPSSNHQANSLPLASSSESVVDWENFDFSTLSEGSSAGDPSAVAVSGGGGELTHQPQAAADESLLSLQPRAKLSDLDLFFATVDIDRNVDGIYASNDFDDANAEDEENYSEIELVPGSIIPMEIDTGGHGFTTPIAWLDKLKNDPPNGIELVDYEVWSKYDPILFHGGDDEEWLEDRYLSQAVEHITKVLKLYLRDHDEMMEHVEDCQFIEKYVRMKLDDYYHDKLKIERVDEPKPAGWGRLPTLENNANLDARLLQDIPVYLVPELHVGVNYTDTVFEMRNKRILEPEREDPRVQYKDDKFAPNDEVLTLNEVGTIREQYNWLPEAREHAIDISVAEKLQPVIQFLNHAAELQSTKVTVSLDFCSPGQSTDSGVI
jgi:hypothetical protein